MLQVQGIVKGDTRQKFSSIGLIVGALLLIIFNILAPRPEDPTSMQSTLVAISDQKVLTQLSQLLLALAIWLVMLGLAGVFRSITERGAAWVRLGFYGVVVGTTLWSITFGLGTVTVNLAAEWASVSGAEKATVYDIASAVSAVTSGTETMSIIMFWLPLILLGIGMALSDVYPRWLGWTAITLGIVMVAAVGVPKFFVGYTSTRLLIFGVIAVLTTVWFLVLGISIARKSW